MNLLQTGPKGLIVRLWQFLNIGELYASKGRVVSYEENDVLRFFDANVIMEGNYCFIDWILSPLEMKSKPDTKELIILYKDNGICLPLYVNDETKMLYDNLKWSHDEYDMKIELDETMFNRAKLPIIPHPNAIYAKQNKRTITQEEIEVLVGRNRFSRFIFKHI